MTNKQNLHDLIMELGGRIVVAEKLDVSPVAIHQWIHGERELPLKRALQLCRMSNHTVSLKDLLPLMDI